MRGAIGVPLGTFGTRIKLVGMGKIYADYLANHKFVPKVRKPRLNNSRWSREQVVQVKVLFTHTRLTPAEIARRTGVPRPLVENWTWEVTRRDCIPTKEEISLYNVR